MIEIEIIEFRDERYVWSKDLYKALDLNFSNYKKIIESWLEKEYLFQGNIEFTIPVKNFDYYDSQTFLGKNDRVKSISDLINNNFHSYRTTSETLQVNQGGRGVYSENYLIRLELAKLIALDSNSKLKKQFVQWLLSLEAKVDSLQLISRQTLLGLMEMVKMCSYIDNQIDYYKQHKDKYFEFKEEDDSWFDFDRWRNSILKLMNENELNNALKESTLRKVKTKYTKVEKLAMIDTLESIRASLFDFLSQQLRPYTNRNLLKARDLADFVKKMFETAGIERIDIKSRGFGDNRQLDLFRKLEDIDIMLISNTIKAIS